MRYFFQVVVVLTGIAIIAAVAVVIYMEPLNIFVWIMVILTFRAWHSQGGFAAWSPKHIKIFLQNAKKISL